MQEMCCNTRIIELSNDPRQALEEIAERIAVIRKNTEGQKYPRFGDKTFTGYVMPIADSLELHWLQIEAERVAASSQVVAE